MEDRNVVRITFCGVSIDQLTVDMPMTENSSEDETSRFSCGMMLGLMERILDTMKTAFCDGEAGSAGSEPTTGDEGGEAEK